MKIHPYETEYVFGFDLAAETLEDAAWIVRFQHNVKREFPRFGARASSDGRFHQYFSFLRKFEKTSEIK